MPVIHSCAAAIETSDNAGHVMDVLDAGAEVTDEIHVLGVGKVLDCILTFVDDIDALLRTQKPRSQ